MPQNLDIAVLTDVHGNAFAAEAVIADIRRHQPDLIVNLGDQLWGQADPARALEWQRELGAVEVRGNNDERLTMAADQLPARHRQMQAWLAARIPDPERARLAGLPLTARLVDGAVLAAHGTPRSPWDSLLLEWDGAAVRRRPDAEIEARLDDLSGVQVVLVGHMHREDQRTLDGRLLVNVGAVSWQNDGDPRARWALLQRRGGVWSVQHRRVTYDWAAAAAHVLAHGAGQPEEAALHTHPVTDPVVDASPGL